MKKKHIYRVTSVHERLNFDGTPFTYTRTRHFFSKTRAFTSYTMLKQNMENWDKIKANKYDYRVRWGRPTEVYFDVSDPVVFKVDFEGR